MIDLHSHILPGIDDGARDLDMSIAMARASVANGVTILACTPHITPGVWNNKGPDIRAAIANLQKVLDEKEIPLSLVTGADVHIAPNLVEGIRSGQILTLHDSRYILLELPHHVLPRHADQAFFSLLSAGYVPLFTHPERVSWIETNYELIRRLGNSGVWMQITAGSLTGAFGKRPQYWAERMLDEGLVHILASDTHNTGGRAPILAEGWEAACRRIGENEAYNLVITRPYGILKNVEPNTLPPPPVSDERSYGSNAGYSEAGETAESDGRDRAGAGGGSLSRWVRGLIRRHVN